MPAARRAKAALAISSRTKSQNDLGRLVGITADEMWQIGAVRPGSRTGQVYPHSGLRYLSHTPESGPPSEHLAELIERVSPAAKRLAEFAAHAAREDPSIMPVQINLYLEADTAEVGLSLPAAVLAGIVSIGAQSLGVELLVDSEEHDS